MHRHGNWDCVFTTPNIKKVRPEIRAASECAYKHKNLAIIGLRGSFVQSMHLAEDNGNPSDIYSQHRKRIPKWVWQCYSSTATGAFRDTGAGSAIWKNPNLLFMLGVVAVCLGVVISMGRPRLLGGEGRQAGEASGDLDREAAPASSPVPVATPGLRDGRVIAVAAEQPSKQWRLVAVITHVEPELSRVYVASGRRVVGMDIAGCRHGSYGWGCRVDDGIATQFSGPEPVVDGPASMPVIALA